MKPVLLSLAIAFIALLPACSDRVAASPDETAERSVSANAFPRLTGRVVDQADLLRPEQEIDVSAKSAALEAQTGRQFVIVTVDSLGGQDVTTYTRDLGRHWGIGHKDRNDGVILLVAPNERQARIAVGYGLEKTVTNGLAQEIMDERIVPRFREGDMPGGIVAGADALVAQLSRPPEASPAR
jgi:uncharacterized protein